MKIAKTILVTVLLLSFYWSVAQTNEQQVSSPEIRVFAPILRFLASPGLEGRETGNQGGTIAADYIASMMHIMGLKPFQKVDTLNDATLPDYFQTFGLLRFWAEKNPVIIKSSEKGNEPLQLIANKDFSVKNAFQSFSIESTPVFAGYGINSPDLEYNDYTESTVKGKLVIILDGYPGQNDTTSMSWHRFRSLSENDVYNLEMKCREAARRGAAAIMVVNRNYLHTTTDNAAIVGSIGPVSTLVLAWFFLQEGISLFQIVGTIMILFGVLLISGQKRKELI